MASMLYVIAPSAIKEMYITNTAGDVIDQLMTGEEIQQKLISDYRGMGSLTEDLGIVLRRKAEHTSINMRKCYLYGKRVYTIPEVQWKYNLKGFGQDALETNAKSERDAGGGQKQQQSNGKQVAKTQSEPSGLDAVQIYALIGVQDLRIKPDLPSASGSSNKDQMMTVSFSPSLGLEVIPGSIGGNPIPIKITAKFRTMFVRVPNSPCNSVMDPPIEGANKESCCGFEGPEYCTCQKIECQMKCKKRAGIRNFECDQPNYEITTPKCECWITDKVLMWLIILIVLIVLGSLAFIAISFKRCMNRWAENGGCGCCDTSKDGSNNQVPGEVKYIKTHIDITFFLNTFYMLYNIVLLI